MSAQYTGLDWLVFAAYGLLLIGSGWFFNRRSANSQDYFRGGNTMPVWAVAISVLATSQSAATFLGGPDQGYRGDLSYLANNNKKQHNGDDHDDGIQHGLTAFFGIFTG